jgi:hypothetical protein
MTNLSEPKTCRLSSGLEAGHPRDLHDFVNTNMQNSVILDRAPPATASAPSSLKFSPFVSWSFNFECRPDRLRDKTTPSNFLDDLSSARSSRCDFAGVVGSPIDLRTRFGRWLDSGSSLVAAVSFGGRSALRFGAEGLTARAASTNDVISRCAISQ